MSGQSAEIAAPSGRPHSERDGACICDYNPSTTDGPDECCPFHGRPYAYWIERGDALAERIAAVEALAAEWAMHTEDPRAWAAARILDTLGTTTVNPPDLTVEGDAPVPRCPAAYCDRSIACRPPAPTCQHPFYARERSES